MSVELSVATTNFMGDSYTFIDCPGSVEFVHDMRAALPAVDAAVVVCEADEKKIPQLQLILRELEDLKIPRFLFLNKIDKADKRVRETLQLLQPASRVPLVLRQIPIWKNDIVTGFVDLALERAHVYKEHAPSEVVPLEGENLDREKDARFSMLETLADHDDELMEQLLEDIPPPRDKVFDDLAKELRDGLVVPGADRLGDAHQRRAAADEGAAPRGARASSDTAKRLGVKPGGEPLAYVLKTLHTAHGGKMSIARVLAGQIGDGTTFITPEREAGRVVRHVQADRPDDREARPRRGGRDRRARQARSRQDRRHADRRQAGASRRSRRSTPLSRRCWRSRSPPRSARTTSSSARRCNKLVDEDPSLTVVHNPETHEVVVWGQGEMHLRVATERLADRFGVAIEQHKPTRRLPRDHQEAGAQQRGRHKKQSGGHGQFGDVVLDIKPLPRGSGFKFEDKITGGVVPRNYIPSVEEGVIDALKHGPLGFPVVDVAVTLIDGSYHTVDSSDMAFRTRRPHRHRRGAAAMRSRCCSSRSIWSRSSARPTRPPRSTRSCPAGAARSSASTPARAGPAGTWCRRMMPEAEIGDLIIEVRSATAGVGSFTFKFDHMAELTGSTADQIVAARRAGGAGGGLVATAGPVPSHA